MSSFDPESDVAYSGVYNLIITIGFTNTFELFKLTIFFQLSALILVVLALSILSILTLLYSTYLIG
jgi:hypothetical protein